MLARANVNLVGPSALVIVRWCAAAGEELERAEADMPHPGLSAFDSTEAWERQLPERLTLALKGARARCQKTCVTPTTLIV